MSKTVENGACELLFQDCQPVAIASQSEALVAELLRDAGIPRPSGFEGRGDTQDPAEYL